MLFSFALLITTIINQQVFAEVETCSEGDDCYFITAMSSAAGDGYGEYFVGFQDKLGLRPQNNLLRVNAIINVTYTDITGTHTTQFSGQGETAIQNLIMTCDEECEESAEYTFTLVTEDPDTKELVTLFSTETPLAYDDVKEYYLCLTNSNGSKITEDCDTKPIPISETGFIEIMLKEDGTISITDTNSTYDDIGQNNKTPDEIDSSDKVDTEASEGDSFHPDSLSDCLASGAVKDLGWIVCPILDWMSNAAEQAYNDYVAPSLQVQAQLFDPNGNGSETYSAWEVFRNFANIIFIIFLLVIIFSQLTGVGIDNYGIKKSLPKFILAAILVNFSFIICQLCIDVSNITGNGIQKMFQNMTEEITKTTEIKLVTERNNDVEGGEKTAQVPSGANESGSGGIITAVVVLFGVVSVVGLILNPAILLTLLIAALGVIVSIFFLFLLLSARQAVIIVLTVLSPLAFVCFILPNAKNLFSKWLSIWKTMLLLYPICGLMVGGGNYVSRLLLEVIYEPNPEKNGFLAAFTAMIVGIVPIFFIPTVVKSAFSVLGKLGTTISNFGRTASRATTRSLSNSEANKRLQQRSQERRVRIRAGVDRNGNTRKLGKVGTLLRGGKRNVAANRVQYLKNEDAKYRANSLMGVGYTAAKINQSERIENEKIDNFKTLVNSETRNGEDTGALYRLYEQYLASGNAAGAIAVARIAGRRKDTADSFFTRYIKDNDQIATYTGPAKQAFDGVMKEIATGENSGVYQSAMPLGFTFTAQYNANIETNPDKVIKNYQDWKGNASNIDSALKNVKNTKDLIGIKGSELKEINKLLFETDESGNFVHKGETYDKIRNNMQSLAKDAIKNKGTNSNWDVTKEHHIEVMANGGSSSPTSADSKDTPAPTGSPSNTRTAPDLDAIKALNAKMHDEAMRQMGVEPKTDIDIMHDEAMRQMGLDPDSNGIDVPHNYSPTKTDIDIMHDEAMRQMGRDPDSNEIDVPHNDSPTNANNTTDDTIIIDHEPTSSLHSDDSTDNAVNSNTNSNTNPTPPPEDRNAWYQAQGINFIKHDGGYMPDDIAVRSGQLRHLDASKDTEQSAQAKLEWLKKDGIKAFAIINTPLGSKRIQNY